MKTKPKWYRKWDLDVPREVIEASVAKYGSDPEKYSHSSIGEAYCPPDSDAFCGKTLVFRGEDRVYTFAFGEQLHALRFSENGGEEKACWCNVKTMDGEIFLVNQLIPGYACSRQVSLIADMKTGSATICDAHVGTEHSNIDVGREFFFGKLDGEFPESGPLHGFTDELVGKAVDWDYGKIVIKHMYTSNLYYTYSHPSPTYGAWMATNPADYVKLRDNIYIFSFVEERQHGLQALFVIDLNRWHDIGCFYGVSADHMTSACIGAQGTPAPLTTIF